MMKHKIVSFLIIYISSMYSAFSQESSKNAIVVNVGYPTKIGFYYVQPIYNRRNLLFWGIGLERQLPNNIFYSISLANYNMLYETCKCCLCYDNKTSPCMMSRIELKISIWKEIELNKRNILDVGIGTIGHYELEMLLNDIESHKKRMSVIGYDIGFHWSAKYYYVLPKIRNQLGLVIECNWFGNTNQFEHGIGLTYRYKF